MRRKISSVICVLFCLTSLPLFAFDVGMRGLMDNPPEPRLISPIKETADLSGKDSMEFKWYIMDYITDVDSYDFRLYKGYITSEANLISKLTVDGRTDSVQISARLFADGEIYTWALRRTFNGGKKSERSSSSFKTIKK